MTLLVGCAPSQDHTVDFSKPVEKACLLGTVFHEDRFEVQEAYQKWTVEQSKSRSELAKKLGQKYKPRRYRDPSGVAAWVEPIFEKVDNEYRLCYWMHVPKPTPENYKEVMCLMAHEEMHPMWHEWHDNEHMFEGC